MAKKKKRGTAPAPGAVLSKQETVDKAIDLIRKIILATQGGRFSVSIDGKKIEGLWQAVPGYSNSVYFIPEDYDSENQQFVVHCTDPILIFTRYLNGKIQDMRITTKGNQCRKEMEVNCVDTKVIKRAKILDLIFREVNIEVPLRFGGTL